MLCVKRVQILRRSYDVLFVLSLCKTFEDGIDIFVQVTKAVQGIEGIKKRTGIKTIVSCHGEPFWQRHAIVRRRQKGILRRIMWVLFNRKRYADGTLAMRKAVERTLHDYGSCDAYTVLCDSYKSETEARLGLDPSKSHIYVIENPERPVPVLESKY